MPVYDYACQSCGLEWEAYHEIEERNSEWCDCGELAKRIYFMNGKPVVYEYYSENLGARITGPAQRQRLMKEKDLSEVG